MAGAGSAHKALVRRASSPLSADPMGGYAALQTSVLDADLLKAIIAIAPVSELDILRGERENFTSHGNHDCFVSRGEHVAAGAPARHAAAIKAPVLLFHGDQGRNVGVGEIPPDGRSAESGWARLPMSNIKGLTASLATVGFAPKCQQKATPFCARHLQ